MKATCRSKKAPNNRRECRCDIRRNRLISGTRLAYENLRSRGQSELKALFPRFHGSYAKYFGSKEGVAFRLCNRFLQICKTRAACVRVSGFEIQSLTVEP